MPQIGWLELLSVVIIAILVLGPKEFPIALKKIGSYIGKFKNTLSNLQKEVSSATKNIDLEKETNISNTENKKENKKMADNNSFTSHFVELRNRLLNSLIFILVAFIISYIFAEQIYSFLVEPYASAVKDDQNSRRLIFTALHETFITYIKVAFFAAIFFGSPIILIQIYKFIAPGLYKNEKKAILPYLISTPILFLLGGTLVYYLVMPLAIKFFLSFETLGSSTSLPIQLEAKVNEYLSLIMRLIFAFGISFQLPILLNLLARIGVVNSDYLKNRRRYVIVIIFALAAILTPPDPITQIGLAIPLLLLYELSIFTVKFIEKKKEEVENA